MVKRVDPSVASGDKTPVDKLRAKDAPLGQLPDAQTITEIGWVADEPAASVPPDELERPAEGQAHAEAAEPAEPVESAQGIDPVPVSALESAGTSDITPVSVSGPSTPGIGQVAGASAWMGYTGGGPDTDHSEAPPLPGIQDHSVITSQPSSTSIRALSVGAEQGRSEPDLVASRPSATLIAGIDRGTVTEDQYLQSGQLETSGQLTINDPDAGQDHFTAQKAVAGSNGLGHFSIDTTGHWVYSADNTQDAIQHLKTGQHLTDSLVVTSADGTAHTIIVTIQGTNDAPVLQAQTQAVTEDGSLLSGRMVATDVDAGDTHTFSIAKPVDGFTLNADGGYTFDPSHISYQHLVAGQTQDVVIPLTVTDSAGATSTQNLMLTVTGMNDRAVITGASTGAVSEDVSVTPAGALETSGQLTVTDVDTGEAHFAAQSGVAGAYGQFNIDAAGHWTYQAFNGLPAIQRLRSGDSLTDSFTVSSIDGTTQTVSVTINGTNDAPQIAQTNAVARIVTEDSPTSAVSGTLHARDVDAGDTLSWSVANGGQGTYGHLDFDAQTGQWTYHLDNANANTNALGAGQTGSEVFQITATDSQGATGTTTVRISVVGTNDAAHIAGASTGIVAEDQGVNAASKLIATGTLSVTDVDTGEAYFVAQTDVAGASGYGSFSIDAKGNWTYLADNSQTVIQSLSVGQQVTDSIVVHSADGTAHTLTVTITGTNDAPTVAHALTTTTATEDAAFSFVVPAGTFADKDSGDALTLSAGTLPAWLHFDAATGTFSGTPANGDVGTQHITVIATDSSGAQVSTTFNLVVSNTNDAPTLNPIGSVRVTEDGAQASGQFTATDPDSGDSLTYSIAQPVDGLTVNADGSWSFDPSHASYQHLKAGQTQVLTIPVTVTDSAGATSTQNLVIKVNGTNDGALITGADVGALTEDQTAGGSHYLQATGTLSVTDVDTGEAAFQASTSQGHYGDLVLHSDGQWMYQAGNTNPAVQALKAGEQATDNFTVHSADGTAHTVTVTITGTNDAPTVAHALTTTAAAEDAAFSFGIPKATFADLDTGDTLTLSTSSLPAWLHFDAATGTFSGTPANGDVGTQHITVTATDGSGAQVSSTFDLVVSNTNDAPTLNSIASVRVTEDGAQATGQFTATDPDTGDTLTYSIAQPVDGLTVNADGSWSFDPAHASYQHLTAGQTQVLTIPVTVTDSAGATSTQDLVIKVNGTNDGAVIAGTDVGTVTEDQTAGGSHYLQATGTLSVTDVDAGEAVFQAGTTQGHYGDLVLHRDGQWMYQADNTNPAVQALKAGEQATDTFTVTSADGTAHTITVTITGTNDAPTVAHALTTTTATEDAAFIFAVPAGTFADIDTGDTLTLSTGSLPSWLHFDAATGTFSGTPANGDVGTTQVTVTATDGSGAQISTTFNLVVSNTNDVPTLNPINVLRITEDGAQASGHFTATDPDAGDTLAYSIAQPVDGLTVNADGSWSFDPSHASYQHLAAGQSQILTIPVTVTDSAGATSTQSLAIEVTGTNDGARITGTDASVVKEDVRVGSAGRISVYGKLDISDIDTGEAAFTYHGPFRGAIQGQYGSLGINTDGSWEYDANNASLQGLREGQQVTDTITVTSKDGTTHAIVITITGTNDGPTVAHALTTTTATEDTAFRFGIPKGTFADIDSGDTLTLSTGSLPSWLHFDAATGTFSGTPSNGDVGTTPITVTAIDGSGAQVSTTFNLVVSNTNDAPILNPIASVRVTEDGAQAKGKFTATDPDSGDTLTYSIAQPVDGLTVNADGSWSFDPSHASYQHLSAGQTQTLTIPVTVTDASGATSTQDLVIKINGTNDGAVIAGTDVGAVTEDQTAGGSHSLQATGTLTVTDVDAGESVFQASTSTGQFGELVLHSDGQWMYQADNSSAALQALKAGQQATESFTVHSADGTAHTITVTLTGANDGAVISGTDTGDVTEDIGVDRGGHIATSGVLAVSDADAGEAAFAAQGGSSAQGYGVFALGPHGQWTYSADNTNPAIQALKAGDSLTDSFTVHSADGTTHTVSITIHGTNDAPAIGATRASARFISEDAASTTITGLLHSRDIDSGDTLTWTVSGQGQGTYGHLDFDPVSGNWTYRIDNADADTNALASGQRGEDVFQITATDSSGASASTVVRVLVMGANDGALISGVDAATLTEDQTSGSTLLTANGLLSVTDVDTGEAVFQAQTGIVGQYGSFAVTADGAWSYSADNTQSAIQQLKAGDTLTDSFTVHSADGTTHTVTVTIAGSNDAPVLAAQTQAVIEDGIQLIGRMVATDVDTGDTRTFSIANAVDGFTLNADGSYSFDPSHASYQHLAAGQTQDVVIPITVTDSSGTASTQNLTVTVTGTNDAAVITGTDAGAVAEDGVLRASGQLLVSDVDDGQASFRAQARVPGHYGVFSLAADGTWTYDLNNSDTDVQALTKGQSLSDSMVAKSADGSSHTITVSIQGRDDGAVIAGVDTGRVTEDQNVIAGQLQTSGQLTLNDADVGNHQFTAMSHVAGHYGVFSIDANGTWTYTADNSQDAVQQLGRNDSLVERFHVTSDDGTQHTVLVTLQGSNDTPVIQAQTRSVTEDGAMLTGQMRASDTDIHDRLQFSTTAHIAGFTLAADGSYSFDPKASAYQNLGAGVAETLNIPVTVRDQFGAQHTRDLLITVTGTNDGAIIQGKDHGDVVEDLNPANGLLRAQGHLGVTDADASQSAFVVQTGVVGHFGRFSIDADGAWTYVVDNSSDRVQALREGAQAVEHFVVRSLDGTSHAVRVTVHGSNDAPVVTSIAQTAIEDGALLHGQLRVTDRDRGDQAHFQLDHPVAGFTLDSDGSYRFDPSDPAHQDLRQGQVMRLDIPVTVTDDAGAVVHHTISITLTGRNDAAVISGTDRAALTEDSGLQNGLLQASGQLQVSDIDDGEAHFTAQNAVAGSRGLGHFSINAAGQWIYTVDNTQAAVQQLQSGDSLTERFTVYSADGSAHTVTVTIAGSNDAPVLTAQTQAVTEDGARLSGRMVATDVDAGDMLTFSLANAVDGFTLNADGSYSFDPGNAAYQHLTAGQTQDVVIPITVTDSAGATSTQNLTITVTGSNDGAVITGHDFRELQEDVSVQPGNRLAVDGVLTITDPDAGEAHFIAQADVLGSGGFGHFSIDTDGQWHYEADNSQSAIQSLRPGDARLVDSLVVTSVDGTTHTLSVSIQGMDDAPVLTAQTQAVAEDGMLLTGQMVATDVDTSDTLSFSLANAVDGFTLNADGSYSFDPSHASYQHLAAGQTQNLIIPITVTDIAGATSTQNLTITLTGSNDGPQVTHGTAATAADLGTINEDTPRVFSEADLLRLVGASDVDDGAQLHIVAGSLTSAHGTFTGDSAHGYTFTPAANFSGQDVDLKFSVTDGTVSREAFASLDITPVADAPDRLAGKPLADNFDSAGGTGGWRTNSGAPIHLESSTLGGQGALLLHGQSAGVLHQDFDTFAGQRLQVTFDLSAADGRPASQLEVVWEGKVIATLGTSFQLHDWSHHVLDLVASGPGSRLEFRPANADRATGVKLDNIGLSFVDVRAHREAIASHDAQLHLEKEFVLTDTDGSESLHYLIKGLPVGFTLSDGTHSVTVAQADQAIDTRGWQQEALRVQAPQDYTGAVDIQVTARSEEAGNQQTADAPILPMRLNFESADVLRVAEDTPKTFSADKLLALAGLVAAPGQQLSLSDVQVDAALGHFSHNSDGSWTFSPAANVSADQVPVTLTASGGAQPLTASLSLNITPVADAPVGGLTVNTDFDHQAVGSDGWAFVDGAGLGWHTDYAKGIEVGQDKLYGGTSSTNQIVELVANGGSNLYRVLPTTAGQALHFGFDLSARAGNTVATLEVVWEGKVIDTIKPGSAFGLVHHDYDLVATGANSRIELRATGGDGRSIIDNLAISAPPQVALVNHALHLALGQSFQLADTDGSEIISYLIHGLPVGFTLSDGSHSTTVTTAGQVIDTAGWQIDAVRLEAPKDFEGQLDLKISARSEEGATHETATSAELPLPLRFERLSTAEDTPRSFSERELLQLAGVVPAAGEHLSISAVQVDPAFGQLTHNSDGSWTFTPAANVSADQVALNITVSGGAQPQQVSLPLQITAITDAPLLGAGVSRSDFELERVTDSSGSQFYDPVKFGWHSDGAGGVEVGPETSFGGSRSGNQVLELISKGASGAKVPNLYRDLTTEPGQALHFAFDLSRRAGWAVGPVEVLWEGKVIDTITPGDSGFALHHHAYDLVATGTSARLELRVPGDTVDQRAVLDNLYIGPPPQLALVNHELHLKLGDFFNLADTDGSESLSYLIKGLPVGFTLSDGSHSVTVTAADQVIDTQGWQQSALSVQAPKDFAGTLDLSISGRSEEVSTHQTATSAELPLRLSFESLATNEDTPLTLSESKLLALSGIVPGAGEHLSLSDVQVDPALGQFNHNADGSWTFIPASNVNADQVPFTLTVSGGSQPLSAALQLSITPVNDAPVLAAQTQAVTEDGTVLHGQLSATDLDAGDTLHYSLAHAVDGFTLNADGSYSFDPSHAAYQHLAGGQTQDLVIPVTVTDSAGAASTQNLTITVTGTDDGLQVAHATAATAADLGAINEDTPRVFTEAELLQAVGASNVDDGTQLHIVAGSLTSPHGSFSGDAAHGYTFTPAANFSGQDVDLQFSVTDGTVSREAHAQLDITPVADAPVRSGGFSITTDFNSVDVGAVGWKLSDPSPLGWHSSEASGVEIGQERLYGGSGNNQILSLTASWSSNIYRDLATQAGQTVHVGFDLSARPGFAMTPVEVLWEGKVIDTISPTAGTYAMQHHGYDLVATGSNSRLEFRATGQGEARALFDNIQIGTPDHLTLGKQDVLLKPYLGYQLADTDGSETLSYEVHGLPVGFTLTDGSHSVTVATAGQLIETRGWNQDALAVRAPQDFQGDVSIQVTARAEEGGTHQTASAADLTLHLSGSHVAVISGESAITLTEDQHVNAQGKLEYIGKLAINDPDAGEAKFVPQNAVGTTYGSYTIGQDGNWIYQANNSQEAIQRLKTGEHLTDSFTVHSADGTAHTINVTIQGQDDAPAFVPHAGPTRSDDVYSQIGQAFESMIHQNFKYLGDMLLHGADTYPFERAVVVVKNAGVSFIAPDGSVAQAFAPHGTLTEVPIADMIAWHAKGAGYQVVFTDAKASEIGVYAHNSGNPGMLSGRGSYSDWVLHPEQSAAQLTPLMHDVAAASSGAAVQGAAVMPPAIAPLEFDSAHVLEDNGQQIAGFIEVKDADADQSSMQPQTGTATHYGRFSIDVNGDWVYQLDTQRPEVQQLTDGQSLVDSITVHSADGTAHEVNITIHGQNDGAVITGADRGHVQLGISAVAQGQLQVSDVDSGQAGFALTALTGSYGSLGMDTQGNWQYILDGANSAVHQLSPQDTLTDHLTVHSLDGTAHSIDIQISGDFASVQASGQPSVVQPSLVQPSANPVSGTDIYQGLLASVHAAGYQYRGLADALDRGDLGVAANLAVSIGGSHVQVIDAAGQVLQSFSPITADNAAVLPLRDVMQWHAQGYSIVASEDSGADTTRMWLHDTGDMHHITVQLPDGTGFNAWTDQWTFGELQLNAPNAPASSARSSSDQQDFDLVDTPAGQFGTVMVEAGHAGISAHDDGYAGISNVASSGVSGQSTDSFMHPQGDLTVQGTTSDESHSLTLVTADGNDNPYLQFADLTQQVSTAPTTHLAESPVNDYFAVAGVDVVHTATSVPDLPPTEVLLDTTHAAESHTALDHSVSDDAALATAAADIPDQSDNEQHHHGV